MAHSPGQRTRLAGANVKGVKRFGGYRLLREVRAREGGAAIHAIALTAYASEADRARTRAAGFDAHITKPIDLPALLAAIAAGLA